MKHKVVREFSDSEELSLPCCKNLSISIHGGGGGGAGALYDNIFSVGDNFYSSGGGGGGCGQVKNYFIKRLYKSENIKIIIGKGGNGGIGGLEGTATNGDCGRSSKIILCGKKIKAKGGKGGKIGINSKIGGNGGNYGGGGGGGYMLGGKGGKGGQSGTGAATDVLSPNMKGGNGANNNNNSGNGSVIVLRITNYVDLYVGGGGGGCGIGGGQGGSCGTPAKDSTNSGEGGGGGAGFNLDSSTGAFGGKGGKGLVVIKYRSSKKYSGKNTNIVQNKFENAAINVSDNITTCLYTPMCGSNPLIYSPYNFVPGIIINTIIKLLDSTFLATYGLYKYVTIEIGAGGGGGGPGANNSPNACGATASGGGGGGSGEKFILASLPFQDMISIYFSVTLGIGGNGASNGNGSDGGDTVFTLKTQLKSTNTTTYSGTLKGGKGGHPGYNVDCSMVDGHGGDGGMGGINETGIPFFSYGGGGGGYAAQFGNNPGSGECNYGSSTGTIGINGVGGNGGGPPPNNVGGIGGQVNNLGTTGIAGGGGGGGANGGNGGQAGPGESSIYNGEDGGCGDGGGGGADYTPNGGANFYAGMGGKGGNGYMKVIFTSTPIIFNC